MSIIQSITKLSLSINVQNTQWNRESNSVSYVQKNKANLNGLEVIGEVLGWRQKNYKFYSRALFNYIVLLLHSVRYGNVNSLHQPNSSSFNVPFTQKYSCKRFKQNNVFLIHKTCYISFGQQHNWIKRKLFNLIFT